MIKLFLKHKYVLIALLIIIIVNGIIAIKSFQQVSLDLRIAQIKTEFEDGIYKYRILIKNSRPINKDTSVLLIYQDGTTQSFSYDLNHASHHFSFNTSKRLEFVSVKTPEGMHEANIVNNQYFINPWSPEVQIFDSFSVPDYDYLIDKEGRIWFVSSGRDGRGIPLGIHLTLVDSDGEILIYKRKLSDHVYSTYPVLRYINNNIHILWSSIENNQGYLVHYSFEYLNHQLITRNSQKIMEDGISFEKIVVKTNNIGDPNVLVLRNKGSQSGFALFQITPEGLKEDFNFDVTGYNNLSSNSHFGFEGDNEGNYSIFWNTIISQVAVHNFTKVNPKGEILININNFLETSAAKSDLGLKVLKSHNKYILLFSEFFGTRSWSSQVCFAVLDENGNFLKEKTVLDDNLALDITGVVDDHGTLNLVWTRRARAKSGTNFELFFQKFDSDFTPQTPIYQITENLVDKFNSLLKLSSGERYLVWRVFDGDKYQLYLGSTKKEFGLRSPANIGPIEKGVKEVVDFAVSEVTQIVTMLFYNVFPLASLLMVIVWIFSIRKTGERFFHWLLGFLVLLFLEYLNFDYLRIFPYISQDFINRLLTYIFLIYLIGFWILNRKKTSYGKNFLYLLSWILMNSLVITLMNYLYGIV